MNKKIFKNLIFFVGIAAVFIYFFGFGKFKTKEQYYTNEYEEKEKIGTIIFGVYCDAIADETNNDLYKNKILYEDKNLDIFEGESIYDVMVRLQKNKKISLDAEYSEVFNSCYVKGMFDLYEFDYGDLSGWVFHVNKKELDVGCSECFVKNGDVVKWLYSKDLGRDVREDD